MPRRPWPASSAEREEGWNGDGCHKDGRGRCRIRGSVATKTELRGQKWWLRHWVTFLFVNEMGSRRPRTSPAQGNGHSTVTPF